MVETLCPTLLFIGKFKYLSKIYWVWGDLHEYQKLGTLGLLDILDNQGGQGYQEDHLRE